MSIGDVTSDARGSGARYNTGKAPVELIPLRIIASSAQRAGGNAAVAQALLSVGLYQERGELAHLYDAIGVLGATWAECAAVLDYGRQKYAAWNWAKGMPWSVCFGCIGRHALDILSGEEADLESGLPHRGHILCNLVFLIHYAQHYPEGDDRPPPACFATTPTVGAIVPSEGSARGGE